jgi:hypothetical protein
MTIEWIEDRENPGRIWRARAGAFGISIEPAAVGWRADWYAWTRGSYDGRCGTLGFYHNSQLARDQAPVHLAEILCAALTDIDQGQ